MAAEGQMTTPGTEIEIDDDVGPVRKLGVNDAPVNPELCGGILHEGGDCPLVTGKIRARSRDEVPR